MQVTTVDQKTAADFRLSFVMVSWGHEQTIMRRVRIKGRKLDSLAAQLRVENILQSIPLQPSWLPPSAIVCLRQLRDPLPLGLKLRGRNRASTLVWQQALASSVQDQIRHATYPLTNPSSEAAAVIFRDRAELLACLAIDCLEDRLGSRWWWRTLFKNQTQARVMFKAFLNAPQYVPAAIVLLTNKRVEEKFAQALTVPEARTLLQTVTEHFALHELQSALNAGFEEHGLRSSRDKLFSPQVEQHSTPPWQAFRQNGWVHLSALERHALLGVTLTIRRAPAVAKSARFARATQSWFRAIADYKEDEHPPEKRQSEAKEPASVRKPSSRRSLPSAIAPASLGVSASRKKLPPQQSAFKRDVLRPAVKSESSVAAEQSRYHLPLQRVTPPFANSVPRSDSAEQWFPLTDRGFFMDAEGMTGAEVVNDANVKNASAPVLLDSQMLAVTGSAINSFTPESLPVPVVLNSDEVRVETRLGGIFYLINLTLFIGLYGDFTTPAQPGLSLPIFDFVARLGRRLLHEGIKADPLWELLSQLAGERETGEGFDAPDEWRVPTSWLEAFPEKRRLAWTIAGERLRVKHPAGFLMLDLPRQRDVAAQLRIETDRYVGAGGFNLERKPFKWTRKRGGWEQWFDWLTPYVKARLRRALNVSGRADVGKMLCLRRASILLTAVHLDVFFALSELPVAIRLAGLDRDPGWVPAAGRFVRFHYQ